MIDYFFINKALIILVTIFGAWLAFLVFFSNRKSKTNQLFLLMILLALSWTVLCYFSGTLIDNLDISLLLARMAYGATIFFFVPFYKFFSILTNEKPKNFLNIFIPSVSIVIFFLSVFTDFMATEMIPIEIFGASIGVVPVLGWGKFFYFGLVFFVSILVITKVIKRYFNVSQQEKIKLQYFLLGIIIFIIVNLIFNVILAFRIGDARYYQIGNYSIVFLLGFTAFAIVKKELFGIRVVMTALFVGLIAILLFLDILIFTDVIWVQIAKIFVLISFLGLGYSLVRSVRLEIKRREELEILTSKLETTNIKLSSAYRKLESLDKAKSEFISIASHQLRTPLTAIKGYLSMVLEGTYGELLEKMEKPLENIYISNERLIKLVNDLLSVSRIEAGKIELEMSEASVEEIISEVIEELKLSAEKKNIYLKIEPLEKSLPKIMLDGDKIREVIMNIIDNAIRYTEKGGIKVKLKQVTNDKLQIIITDTGEGMSEEELSKLFETFSRGTAGTRFWTEGAGLGLYIARKFVDMHQGKIWAESKGKGKGSTFFVELPIINNKQS